MRTTPIIWTLPDDVATMLITRYLSEAWDADDEQTLVARLQCRSISLRHVVDNDTVFADLAVVGNAEERMSIQRKWINKYIEYFQPGSNCGALTNALASLPAIHTFCGLVLASVLDEAYAPVLQALRDLTQESLDVLSRDQLSSIMGVLKSADTLLLPVVSTPLGVSILARAAAFLQALEADSGMLAIFSDLVAETQGLKCLTSVDDSELESHLLHASTILKRLHELRSQTSTSFLRMHSARFLQIDETRKSLAVGVNHRMQQWYLRCLQQGITFSPTLTFQSSINDEAIFVKTIVSLNCGILYESLTPSFGNESSVLDVDGADIRSTNEADVATRIKLLDALQALLS
jgi:hypothetical protein